MIRKIYAALAVASVLSVAGCEKQVDIETVHRSWWDEHHHGEAYDRDHAVAEHRDWCAQNHDHSCEGWK